MTVPQNKINFEKAIIAAPMAGITTAAFRNILKKCGADYAISEMISAQALVYDNKKTWQMLDVEFEQGDIAIQVSGHEPEVMAEAARRIAAYYDKIGRKLAFIDINMGCPAPKIVRNGDGSALAADADRAIAVAKAVINAVELPVTAKIRLGMDAEHENYFDLALGLEQVGIAAITLHSRYRQQYYSGLADRDKIAHLAAALNIPLIGNGDIDSSGSAFDMLNHGCTGIMIGRACIGNPWLMSECRLAFDNKPLPEEVSPRQRFEQLLEHLRVEIAYAQRFEQNAVLAENIAVCSMRMHMGRYFKGIRYAAGMRENINHMSSYAEIETYLLSMLDEIENPTV